MTHKSSSLPAFLPTPETLGTLRDEKAAAKILGCNVKTLRNWRVLGKGPRFFKLGQRMVRYSDFHLAAFITGEVV